MKKFIKISSGPLLLSAPAVQQAINEGIHHVLINLNVLKYEPSRILRKHFPAYSSSSFSPRNIRALPEKNDRN